MKQTFEEFLMETHARSYAGASDNISDEYILWLEDKDVQEIMDLAEIWGREQYERGEVQCLLVKNKLELDIQEQYEKENNK